MDSFIIRGCTTLYKIIYAHIKSSFLCVHIFPWIKSFFTTSVLIQWYATPNQQDEGIHNSALHQWFSKRSLSKAIDLFKNSYLIRWLTHPVLILSGIYINVLSYVFLPTSLNILVSVGLSTLVFLSQRLGVHKSTVPPSLFYSILALMAIFGIGTVFNEVTSNGLLIFIVYMSTFMFFLALVSMINSKERLKNLVIAIAITTFIVSMHGIYQKIVGVAVDPAWVDEKASAQIVRIYSVFGNPNVFGEFLVLTLPLIFAMMNTAKTKWGLLIFGGIFLLGSVNVMLTYSRGSMVSLALALFLIAVFKDRKYLPLFIIGILAAPFLLPDALLLRILSIFTGGDSSTAYRQSIYGASFNMLDDHYLTGVGLGNFKELYKVYAFSAAKSYHAHNTFLMLLIELGIFGIGAFLAFLLTWTRYVFHAQKSKCTESYLSFAAFAGVIGCLAQAMVDHIFHHYAILFFFFCIIAIGAIAAKLSKEAQYDHHIACDK